MEGEHLLRHDARAERRRRCRAIPRTTAPAWAGTRRAWPDGARRRRGRRGRSSSALPCTVTASSSPGRCVALTGRPRRQVAHPHRRRSRAEPEGAVQEVAVDRSGQRPPVGGHGGQHEEAHPLQALGQLAGASSRRSSRDDVAQVRPGRRHGGVEQGLEAVQFFGCLEHGPSPAPGCSRRAGRVETGAMADGLVLTRRVSERGVHETAQRAGGAGAAARRAPLRRLRGVDGVRLRAPGDGPPRCRSHSGLRRHHGGVRRRGRRPTPRLGAFVVGNQSALEPHRRRGAPARRAGGADPRRGPGALR